MIIYFTFNLDNSIPLNYSHNSLFDDWSWERQQQTLLRNRSQTGCHEQEQCQLS